ALAAHEQPGPYRRHVEVAHEHEAQVREDERAELVDERAQHEQAYGRRQPAQERHGTVEHEARTVAPAARGPGSGSTSRALGLLAAGALALGACAHARNYANPAGPRFAGSFRAPAPERALPGVSLDVSV